MILGIDPGLANCGWGVVNLNNGNWKLIDCGCVVTSSNQSPEKRAEKIYDDLAEIIDKLEIKQVSVEKLFLFKNNKSVMEVAQIIGVVKLLTAKKKLEFFEYTPLQVKMSLVGYGRAEKEQVEKMVRSILNLKETITPSHASDAVAIALTHAFTKRWEK
jgi:crossover junction endodeoxyribonuclease RuvC